jgi:hypothetical protein
MAFLGEAKGFNHKLGAMNFPKMVRFEYRIPYLDARQV